MWTRGMRRHPSRPGGASILQAAVSMHREGNLFAFPRAGLGPIRLTSIRVNLGKGGIYALFATEILDATR